jgi:hypothetical protein
MLKRLIVVLVIGGAIIFLLPRVASYLSGGEF